MREKHITTAPSPIRIPVTFNYRWLLPLVMSLGAAAGGLLWLLVSISSRM